MPPLSLPWGRTSSDTDTHELLHQVRPSPPPPSEHSGPSRPRPAGMGSEGPSMAPWSWQGAGKDC